VAGIDDVGHLVAGVLLARRDDDLGAVLGHALGDGAADAARRAGDHGHLATQVEQGYRLPANSLRMNRSLKLCGLVQAQRSR
jgi:hypothetical protein